jgi:hypothetical protein
VVPLGGDVHQKVQALLPWYVRASLEPEELGHVEAHLAECPRCQADLAWEREVLSACSSPDLEAVGDAGRGFALLRERIAGSEKPPRRRPGFMARLKLRWHEAPPWARLGLLGQCVLVLSFGGLILAAQSPEHRFRALGTPMPVSTSADGGNLIVRFRPDATEQEMRRVLRESKARLVNGPTATDAYVLAVPAGLEKQAVSRLRQEASVLLVESLDGRAVP